MQFPAPSGSAVPARSRPGSSSRFELRLVQFNQMVTRSPAVPRAENPYCADGSPVVQRPRPCRVPAARTAENRWRRKHRPAECPPSPRSRSSTQQRLFIASLALAGPHGRIEQRTTAQAQEAHQPALRKPQTGRLTARLRVERLVLRGIGQRRRGPIDQPHRSTPPVPALRAVLGDQRSRMTRQPCQHLLRQALPCPAVGASVRTAARQRAAQSLDGRLIHCPLGERSALGACARNIDKVSVGKNNRSRYSGDSASTVSKGYTAPVSKLKKV